MVFFILPDFAERLFKTLSFEDHFALEIKTWLISGIKKTEHEKKKIFEEPMSTEEDSINFIASRKRWLCKHFLESIYPNFNQHCQ